MTSAPAFLVAYPFLEKWLERRDGLHVRSWCMDSGAWSVFNAGGVVDLEKYIDDCHALAESGVGPSELFALDVIGDWRASIANAQRMRDAGLDVIPTYHYGEPVELLVDLAAAWPKIALGGVAGSNASFRLKWAEQCFARVWPKRIHGFAFCSPKFVRALPFHSVDSTAWFMQSLVYRTFHFLGKKQMRGVSPSVVAGALDAEVETFLKLEREASARWRNELAAISADSMTLYLAHGGIDYSNRREAHDDEEGGGGAERRDG